MKVGSAPISAINDGSREANILNAIFEAKRDEVMALHSWHGCVTRAVWSPNATVPAFEYDFTYDLPSDCLRVLDLFEDYEGASYNYATNSSNECQPWTVEGRTLLSNLDLISPRFIFRNTDPSSWDMTFAEVLAWALAKEIAYALTQSSDLKKSCEEDYKIALRDARSANGAEGTMKPLIADTWTLSRL